MATVTFLVGVMTIGSSRSISTANSYAVINGLVLFDDVSTALLFSDAAVNITRPSWSTSSPPRFGDMVVVLTLLGDVLDTRRFFNEQDLCFEIQLKR